MPSSFSRLAGRKAMNGSGASTAASGIQLWNGIEPALEIAPIIISDHGQAAQARRWSAAARQMADMLR